MQMDEIAKRLPYFLDAGITVEITGASGIGKSEIVEQTADALSQRDGFEWGLGRHFAATWGPQDVTGVMLFRDEEIVMADGTKKMVPVSKFSMPPWMLDDNGIPLNNYKRGICVLEERDKAPAEVKKALANVELQGGIADWRFHDGIGVIVLSNDASSSRQGSTKDFDFCINRKALLTGTASVSGWVDWATRNGIDPYFVSFAEQHPDVVFSGTVPEKQGPFCTPRSLVRFSKVAKYMMDEDGHVTDKDGMLEIGAGMIGGAAANDVMVWLSMRDQVPSWPEIVKDPKKCKVPENVAGQLMVAHQCAFNVDDKTIEQAVTYMKRLRPEFHLTFAKSATRRNFRLVNSKPFTKWTSEEPQLVALLNAMGGAR